MRKWFSIPILVFLLWSYLFVFIFGNSGALAADPDQQSSVQPHRLKIGLALGGGGAMGFVHIGVLKWLEENRIPVDYLAGNSMGGLIGGCYAMGMSPEEMRALVKVIDWEKLFNPIPPYNSMSFRRKEDRRDYPVEAEIGLRGGVKLPSGLSVYNIDLFLSRLTLPYSGIDNFDQLPIPFRCVATDIVKKEAVVMRDGSLSEALRATMAIPGVFTPVRRNNQLLVDGFLINNLPTDVTKQMGADVVIAVNINLDSGVHEINGIDAVLANSINTVIVNNNRLASVIADKVISPDLIGFGQNDWNALDQFIELGYQAAAKQAAVLRTYAVDEQEWQEYQRECQSRRKINIPIPSAIEVTGTSATNQADIEKRLKVYQGKPLDIAALEKDLMDVTGSGLYESLRYEYVFKNNLPILSIAVTEKPYGPPFVNFALEMKIDGISYAEINPRLRATFFDLAGPRSELRTDICVGGDLNLRAELYKPFANDQWFISPTVFLEQNNSSLFVNDSRTTEYTISQYGVGLDLGYNFSKYIEARLGYMLKTQDTWIRVGDPLPDNTKGTIQLSRFKLTYISADDSLLPRKGLNWDTNICWYYSVPGAPEEFGQAETKLNIMVPVGSQDAFYSQLASGSSFNGIPPLAQEFKLGGTLKLSSYYTDQFHGSNYLLSNIGYLKFLSKLPLTGKDLYLGIWIEEGGVFESWSKVHLDTDLTTGLLSETVLGVVYFGVSYGRGNNPLFQILVGHIF